MNADTLRTLLAQARLHIRRAQNYITSEPALHVQASGECEDAVRLVDRVMRDLAPESEAEE